MMFFKPSKSVCKTGDSLGSEAFCTLRGTHYSAVYGNQKLWPTFTTGGSHRFDNVHSQVYVLVGLRVPPGRVGAATLFLSTSMAPGLGGTGGACGSLCRFPFRHLLCVPHVDWQSVRSLCVPHTDPQSVRVTRFGARVACAIFLTVYVRLKRIHCFHAHKRCSTPHLCITISEPTCTPAITWPGFARHSTLAVSQYLPSHIYTLPWHFLGVSPARSSVMEVLGRSQKDAQPLRHQLDSQGGGLFRPALGCAGKVVP
jgi:hypothetical protein